MICTVAVAPLPFPEIVAVGAEVYPEPGTILVNPTTRPPDTVTVAEAPEPPPPLNEIVAEVYPLPPLDLVAFVPVPVVT